MLRKIASILETILDVILVAAAVMLLVMPLCGYKPYVVRSGSMEPVIQTGAIAYINTHDVSPEQGEIAAYTLSNGEVVTHRVMQIDGDSYTFKGDANDTEDLSAVSKSQIVGTYMFSVPKIGFVLAKVQELLRGSFLTCMGEESPQYAPPVNKMFCCFISYIYENDG